MTAAAEPADDDRDHDRQGDLEGGIDEPVLTRGSLFGDHDRQEQGDERRRDAVVQSALDVDGPPDPDRDRPIHEQRQAQRRVGRRQDRAHQEGEPEAERREQEPADQRSGADRQRQPDGEEPGRDPGDAASLLEADGRGIREQQQGQRQLGEQLDGLRRHRCRERSDP